MRPVEKRDLALMVRSLARNEKHVQSGLVCRELPCHGFRCLYHPEVEYLGLHNQPVFISCTGEQFIYVVLRIARHNPVHKCAIYAAGGLEPVPEPVTEIPQVDILTDAFPEFLPVKENEFAREDEEAFGLVALEKFVSVVQQLRQLAGIR